MGIDSKNLVAASDAFFPFRDNAHISSWRNGYHSPGDRSEMMNLLLLEMNTALQWCLQAASLRQFTLQFGTRSREKKLGEDTVDQKS